MDSCLTPGGDQAQLLQPTEACMQLKHQRLAAPDRQGQHRNMTCPEPCQCLPAPSTPVALERASQVRRLHRPMTRQGSGHWLSGRSSVAQTEGVQQTAASNSRGPASPQTLYSEDSTWQSSSRAHLQARQQVMLYLCSSGGAGSCVLNLQGLDLGADLLSRVLHKILACVTALCPLA